MAGSLEFIKSASGSSVNFLDITDCFSDDYNVYALILGKIDVSADATFVYVRYLDSGGTVISSAEYDRADLRLKANASFEEGKQTSDVYGLRLQTSAGLQTSEGGNATAYIYNPYDSSSYTFSLGQSVNATGINVLQGSKSISVHKSAEQITGMRIARSNSATFENIEVSVYGVK